MNLGARVVLIVAALLLPLVALADPAPIKVDGGLLQGTMIGSTEAWLGVPFAAPPVGNLRWRVPQPVIPWEGTRDARAFGPACMQADDIPKSEDCLTLNIWRPANAGPEPLPVMFWIYGGALAHGNTAQYLGDRLAEQGVIVVSVNYRVGRLGFFAHPALKAEAPDDPTGNYGYLDQLAGLKWVVSNIGAFGGDPKRITIFGESAGGGSTIAHLISPMSRDLFQGAILQSPGLPTPRDGSLPPVSLETAQAMALDYARSVGAEGEGAEALVTLRALPASSLVDDVSAAAVLAGLGSDTPVIGVAGPIIDGDFLTKSPEQAFADGDQMRVPIIVGANNRDLGIANVSSKDEVFALFGDLADQARAAYDPEGAQTFEELKQQVLADRTLVEPSRHMADEWVRAGLPVWWYRFSYVAEALRGDPMWAGTLHGFEIPYTMNLPEALVEDAVTDTDKEMGALASGYWVTFAKAGNPNGDGRPDWPQHDPSMDQVINFTNDGTAVVGPDTLRTRLDLWREVWAKTD
jgi:para-nitrobenzyl esterase